MLFRPDILVDQTRAVTVIWKEMNVSNVLEIDPGTGLEHSVGLDGGRRKWNIENRSLVLEVTSRYLVALFLYMLKDEGKILRSTVSFGCIELELPT